MLCSGWVYETLGISKRFLIKPLQCLLNVPPLKSVLSAKCFIYRVPNWPLFIFNQLAVNFALSCALGQPHPLTSFGRAHGIMSDLAMFVAVRRGHLFLLFLFYFFYCLFKISFCYHFLFRIFKFLIFSFCIFFS